MVCPKLDRWLLIGDIPVLTAELCGLPLLRLAACVGTLARVLRHGRAEARGTAAVTVAHILHTGLDEGVGVQQVSAAVEGWTGQQLLT